MREGFTAYTPPLRAVLRHDLHKGARTQIAVHHDQGLQRDPAVRECACTTRVPALVRILLCTFTETAPSGPSKSHRSVANPSSISYTPWSTSAAIEGARKCALAADNFPAHRTLSDFRALHLKELK